MKPLSDDEWIETLAGYKRRGEFKSEELLMVHVAREVILSRRLLRYSHTTRQEAFDELLKEAGNRRLLRGEAIRFDEKIMTAATLRNEEMGHFSAVLRTRAKYAPLISGYLIICCPKCARQYKAPVYVPSKGGKWLAWTDGYFRAVDRQASTVCICNCETLFLKNRAKKIGFVSERWGDVFEPSLPDIPKFLREEADSGGQSFWEFIKGLFTKARNSESRGNKEEIWWPDVSHIDGLGDVGDLLAKVESNIDPELEIAVRRECWWKFNDIRRAGAALESEAVQLSESEKNNLKKLLMLLLAGVNQMRPRSVDDEESKALISLQWLTIGEIQREMGYFEGALRSFSLVNGKYGERARLLERLACRQLATVVECEPIE